MKKNKLAVLGDREIDLFIVTHYSTCTNGELARQLNLSINAIRTRCYNMGLKRITMEYFTAAQIRFLKEHYKWIGDCELAELFQQKWPKQKVWTKKHIEKKRSYLRLKRTPAQIKAIHQRNVKKGRFSLCPVKAWNKRGRAPEGEIRLWHVRGSNRVYPVIKAKGRFVPWARWAWEQKYGSVPASMNVVFKDRNPFNQKTANLALLSNQQLARFNAQVSSQNLSDNYVAGLLSYGQKELRAVYRKHTGLLDLKRKQLQLNRIIYEL